MKYTFTVEAGNDPANSARRHPFYITDSSSGGYGQKTGAERMEETVYAGVDSDGQPTAGQCPHPVDILQAVRDFHVFLFI